MAKTEEAGETTAFSFESVDREGVETAAARMGDVVLTTTQRALHPRIDNVENQWRMHTDRRMQARSRLPGTVAYASNKLTIDTGTL